MPKFRKKPIVIEAWQWGVGSDASMPDWLRRAVVLPEQPMMSEAAIRAATTPGQVRRYEDFLHIGTLEGVMAAAPSDWIIKGVKGESLPLQARRI